MNFQSLIDSLKCEVNRNGVESVKDLLATPEGYLKVLEWEMGSLIGPDTRVHFNLLHYREHLELLLSSGGCTQSCNETPSEQIRWKRATRIFGKILESDKLAQTGVRLRLAIAIALTFSTSVKHMASDFKTEIDPISR